MGDWEDWRRGVVGEAGWEGAWSEGAIACWVARVRSLAIPGWFGGWLGGLGRRACWEGVNVCCWSENVVCPDCGDLGRSEQLAALLALT